MKIKVKNAALATVMLVCIVCLCACSMPHLDLMNRLMDEESTLIEEESNEIIRCLTEKDRDGFCGLFSEAVRQTETFEAEVDAVFEYFSCEVYIKSGVETMAGGESSFEDGERTNWSLSPEITYIQVLQKTSDADDELSDRFYGVRYNWQLKDAEHPENEGLQYFEISLLNSDTTLSIGGIEIE